MRCSRVAFSLLLALLAAAVIALGPADGRVGLAADLGLEQSTHADISEGAGHCQDPADWRQQNSTDAEEASTTACYESDSFRDDADDPCGYSDEDDLDDSYLEEGDANEEQGTEIPDADENDYTYDYTDSESEWENDHEYGYANENYEYAADPATEDDNVCQHDSWSESADYDSGYEDTDEADYSYESDTYDSEYDEADESEYSYQSDAYDSGYDEADYSYESDMYDSEYDEADYSYESDAYDAEYDEAAEDSSAYQGYSEAYPEEENAYVEDEEEYTYEYEYSDPEERYGYEEGLDVQSDDEAGDAYKDRSEYDYHYESEGYDGYDDSDEVSGEEAGWYPGVTAEGTVWGLIVSWTSRSLEGLGDAFHTLSRQVSSLNGKTLAVGSRRDRSVK